MLHEDDAADEEERMRRKREEKGEAEIWRRRIWTEVQNGLRLSSGKSS